MALEGKPQYPIGKAKELEATKETLPAIEVANKVIWVNPNLELPFKLEVGKPTKLGVFFTPQETSDNHIRRVEVVPHHYRSGILGRIIFREKGGSRGKNLQIYRDVDIKGLGYNTGDYFASQRWVGSIQPHDAGTRGVMNLQDALHDAEIAELLHEQGIRTHRVIAVIKLDEVVVGGKKIRVEDARKLGYITPSDNPVLEVRAFGSRARLQDLDSPKGKLLLGDAKKLVAEELDINPNEFTEEQYFNWLARTTGKNLGLLKKKGWQHSYLSAGHNITLDGRLVDFDTIAAKGTKRLKSLMPKRFQSSFDFQEAEYAFKYIVSRHAPQRDKILKAFRQGFVEGLK